MFRKNETHFDVRSTYNPNLEGYTTQISREESKAYK